MANSNNKRSLSPEEKQESNEQPQMKKRKLNESQALSFVDKILDAVEDERTYDITFIVGIGDDSEHIRGVKVLFASHSEVLRNMLYGKMSESINKEVIINDITIEAFKYIKEYTHARNPSLEFTNVIYVLYAAQKYMISSIIKQCTEKIQSMNDIATFYLIMNIMSKYAPSTFESVLKDTIQTNWVRTNIIRIIRVDDDHNQFNKLPLYQVQLLVELIVCDFKKYNAIKSYCKTNKNEDETWQQYFEKYFAKLINYKQMTVDELMNDIRSDQVLNVNELLDFVAVKIKTLQQKYNKEKSRADANENLVQTITQKWEKRGVLNAKLRKENKRLNGD